jgi:hypothetical protein
MMVNIIMETPQPRAVQSMICRLPNLSIVPGVKYVPIAKMVFITAARSWDKKGDRPMFANIRVL